MIDEYNSGSANIEELFKKLTAFAQALNEEGKRPILGINLRLGTTNKAFALVETASKGRLTPSPLTSMTLLGLSFGTFCFGLLFN